MSATSTDPGAVRTARPEWHTPKGQRRREQLLRAAIEVVAEHGYAGATQRAIAAAAGVPPASTHYFFDSVDDLIRQATARYLQERLAFYEAQIEAFAATDRSPEAGCRLVAGLLAEVSIDNRTAQFEVYLNARRQADLVEVVQEAIERLEALCARLLETMGVADPEPWAAAFLAVGDGFAIRAVSGADVDTDDVARALLAIVHAAVAA